MTVGPNNPPVENDADSTELQDERAEKISVADIPFLRPSTLTDSAKAWHLKRNPGLFDRAPRAFSHWSREEDEHLRMLFAFDHDEHHLATAHGRLPGAILARLQKLQLIEVEEAIKKAPVHKNPTRKEVMAKKSQARAARLKTAELAVAVDTVVTVLSQQLNYRMPRNDGLWSPLKFEDWDSEIVQGLIFQAGEDGVGVHDVLTSAIRWYLEHRRQDGLVAD